MDDLYFLVILILIVGVGVFFRMYPYFPKEQIRKEGFANPRISPNFPQCIQRNLDAQLLLNIFPTCADPSKSPTDDSTEREELKLILTKLTCLDSDVTNAGVTGYRSMSLQFNTYHDSEPLGNFVGRCLNNGTNEQDITTLIQKYEMRGSQLINQISKRIGMDSKIPQEHYNSLLKVVSNVLRTGCLAKRESLDIPKGVRDPGYSMPFSVEKLAQY
jgi:hypothetical protein